jgi:hypothetical protein
MWMETKGPFCGVLASQHASNVVAQSCLLTAAVQQLARVGSTNRALMLPEKAACIAAYSRYPGHATESGLKANGRRIWRLPMLCQLLVMERCDSR